MLFDMIAMQKRNYGSSPLPHFNCSSSLSDCSRMKSFFGICWTPKLEGIEVDGCLYSLMEDLTATSKRCVEGTRPNTHIFSFSDLKKATKSFRSANVLGEGGFGKVYKGWLHEKTYSPAESGVGMVVAIKKFSLESFKGFEEWQSEVNFLSKLSHPNLIKFIGYSMEENKLLLVHEFMPRGNVKNHLFRRNLGSESLSWELRLKIAIGAARGLAFLHNLENKAFYRYFKPSHILLDDNYNAKISDFGFAKWEPSYSDTFVTTRITSPEDFAAGQFHVKSDVYGFGVVLLQLMTGSKAIDFERPRGQHNLVDWLKPILSNKRKLTYVMDTRMAGQYSLKAMMLAARISSKCIEPDPTNRPSMKQVVEALERIHAIKRFKTHN